MSKIPEERKVLYYIGTGIMVLGFILFFSVFISFASFMNSDFSSFDGSSNFPSFMPAILGIIFIIGGGAIRNVGARGAAGSGVILDPEQAREDLKPYTEAAGGMISDVISNIDVGDKLGQPSTDQEEKEVIKIRCQNCKSLNDEDAKFCKSCGKEL